MGDGHPDRSSANKPYALQKYKIAYFKNTFKTRKEASTADITLHAY